MSHRATVVAQLVARPWSLRGFCLGSQQAISFKMEVEEIAAVLFYVRRRRKKRSEKKKRMWSHPFVGSRLLSGVFNRLYDDLRKYPNKFFNYVRMSISSFDELLILCKNDLTKQDTILRNAIRPEEKLFVTLR